MQKIGRILYIIFGVGFMFRPFFDEQMVLLSHKIIHILSGFIIIYSAINEHKLFKSEKFMNENKKCILPVWKRIFIVIVDVFIVILTLSVIVALMSQLTTTVLMYFNDIYTNATSLMPSGTIKAE